MSAAQIDMQMPELDDQLREKFERIATLLAQGVDREQVALAVGMRVSELEGLEDDERYRGVAQKVVLEHIEAEQDLNRGWDAVEEKALSTLLQHMQIKKDPDFMLRAAAVANKAQRRNLSVDPGRNAPLAMAAGARVVIQLNTQFLTGIHDLKTAARDFSRMELTDRKRVDMMSTKAVAELLNPELSLAQAIEAKYGAIVAQAEAEEESA